MIIIGKKIKKVTTGNPSNPQPMPFLLIAAVAI
jgi:hypothetical protein